jgi:hypothetical protein
MTLTATHYASEFAHEVAQVMAGHLLVTPFISLVVASSG